MRHFCLKSLFYIFIKYIFYFLKTECNLRCKVDEIPFRKAAAVHNTTSGDLDTFVCCDLYRASCVWASWPARFWKREFSLVGRLFLNFTDESRQHKHSSKVKISPWLVADMLLTRESLVRKWRWNYCPRFVESTCPGHSTPLRILCDWFRRSATPGIEHIRLCAKL